MDIQSFRHPMANTNPADTGSQPWFDHASGEIFAQRYNRASFLFRHDLNDDPLFQLPSILELARRQPQNSTYAFWSNGKVGIDDRWEAGQGPRYSLQDTVANIAVNNSLAMLKHVEEDTRLGPVVRRILAKVIELAGPELRNDAIVGRGTILVASPQRLTSYHLDSDVNYLFQISGDKSFSVYPHDDRTLTTHEELERYYSGDANGATFKAARQQDAKSYELRAGCGVHVPSMAAHWARNLDAPSVALSINFDLRSVTRLGRIYRANGGLRRRGLVPTPPGQSAWRDGVKLAALGGLFAARRLVGRNVRSGSTNA
jgi:hypothetical protein